jgi:hypothetical protein
MQSCVFIVSIDEGKRCSAPEDGREEEGNRKEA